MLRNPCSCCVQWITHMAHVCLAYVSITLADWMLVCLSCGALGCCLFVAVLCGAWSALAACLPAGWDHHARPFCWRAVLDAYAHGARGVHLRFACVLAWTIMHSCPARVLDWMLTHTVPDMVQLLQKVPTAHCYCNWASVVLDAACWQLLVGCCACRDAPQSASAL